MSKRFSWIMPVTPLRVLSFCAVLGAIWYGFNFIGEQDERDRTSSKDEAALMRTLPAEPPQTGTIGRSGLALLALQGVRKVEVKDRGGYETVLLMVDPHRTDPSRVVAAGCDVLREQGATENVLVRVIDADKYAAKGVEESLRSMVCSRPQMP